jgi:hypothetical protein
MRVVKSLAMSFAASLLLGTLAHASDAVGVGQSVLTGKGLPWNVETSEQVSEAGAQGYSELNWTSEIGTSMGAALESGTGRIQQVTAAEGAQYPAPDWTSMFGTGTAAALER